jgi:hypothetical protein
MKTQNNKLDFRKNSVVELNDTQLEDINGGSTPACYGLSLAVGWMVSRIISAITK